MQRLRIALSEVEVNVEMRRVRLVAPGKWMLCASFVLPESVAFADTTRLDMSKAEVCYTQVLYCNVQFNVANVHMVYLVSHFANVHYVIGLIVVYSSVEIGQ